MIIEIDGANVNSNIIGILYPVSISTLGRYGVFINVSGERLMANYKTLEDADKKHAEILEAMKDEEIVEHLEWIGRSINCLREET